MAKELRDKGMAPDWGGNEEIQDGENINIPNEAMGYPINVYAARNNLEGKGDANYTGKFKPVVGKQNLLKDQAGFEREDEPGVE